MITYPSGTILAQRVDGAQNFQEAVLQDYFVSTTGTQTISGSKTFDTSPVGPTPTASGHFATKSYVDLAVTGSGVPNFDGGTPSSSYGALTFIDGGEI